MTSTTGTAAGPFGPGRRGLTVAGVTMIALQAFAAAASAVGTALSRRARAS